MLAFYRLHVSSSAEKKRIKVEITTLNASATIMLTWMVAKIEIDFLLRDRKGNLPMFLFFLSEFVYARFSNIILNFTDMLSETCYVRDNI